MLSRGQGVVGLSFFGSLVLQIADGEFVSRGTGVVVLSFFGSLVSQIADGEFVSRGTTEYLHESVVVAVCLNDFPMTWSSLVDVLLLLCISFYLYVDPVDLGRNSTPVHWNAPHKNSLIAGGL